MLNKLMHCRGLFFCGMADVAVWSVVTLRENKVYWAHRVPDISISNFFSTCSSGDDICFLTQSLMAGALNTFGGQHVY